MLSHRRFHSLLSVILMFFLGLVVEAPSVSAAVSGCRGDPIVWLSNGTKLTMIASIAADASQVTMITYTVHAPRGLSVNQVVYTGGVLAGKERVVVLFDRTSGYQVEARAEVGSKLVPVSITVMVENVMRSLTTSGTNTLTFTFA
jgi:hypothetical protein